MSDKIVVEGINELRKALKELGDVDATKEFKNAGYQVAANVVIPKAQSMAAGLGRMQSRAADTLKPVKVVTGGAVRFGSGFVAAFGSEFGATRNAPRQVGGRTIRGWNQFMPTRKPGYFLWPTIKDNSDEIVNEFDKGLQPLYTRLFPN